MAERWSESSCPYCQCHNDEAPKPEIQSSFLDNERRRWSFAYMKDQAHVELADFREVQVAGKTIDDPVHLLTAYSKVQTLFRISTFDPASDWLWACFRATRDHRKSKALHCPNAVGHPGTKGTVGKGRVRSTRESAQNQRTRKGKKARKTRKA